MTLEEIAVGYAIQTNNIRINKKKIEQASTIRGREMFTESHVNLGAFRDALYNDNEDSCGGVHWTNWVDCLYNSGLEFTDREMLLARLLDEKHIFIQARAEFKRALYREGQKIKKA